LCEEEEAWELLAPAAVQPTTSKCSTELPPECDNSSASKVSSSINGVLVHLLPQFLEACRFFFFLLLFFSSSFCSSCASFVLN
jgi:hypothetical protein